MVAPPRLHSARAQDGSSPHATYSIWWSVPPSASPTTTTVTSAGASSSPSPSLGGASEDSATTAVAAAMAVALEPEVAQAAVHSYTSLDVAVTIMTLFALWPLITCGNCLLLAAFRRYKRLRTPSNCLVASLASADAALGLFLPLGVYFELTQASSARSPLACLLPYSVLIALCAVSILSMTAIALDRYTSLARPLRYNNLITKTSVGRYVALFWLYAVLLGAAPIVAHYVAVAMGSVQDSGSGPGPAASLGHVVVVRTHFPAVAAPHGAQDSSATVVQDAVIASTGEAEDSATAVVQEHHHYHYPHHQVSPSSFVCSFDVVGHRVRVFLFFALYAPCAVLLLFAYAYVYIVARYHAQAIYSVELSIRQNQGRHQAPAVLGSGGGIRGTSGATGTAAKTGGSSSSAAQGSGHAFHPRYGWTLAITVGFFLATWTPFQVCMLLDAFGGTGSAPILGDWTRVYLAFVAFANSALNPWVYGYRNAEFRHAYQRILEDLFAKLGVVKKGGGDLEFKGQQRGGRGLQVHRRDGCDGLPSCASNVRLCVSPNHLTMTTLLKPTYVQALETTSCGGLGVTGGSSGIMVVPNGHGGEPVAICETVITSVDLP